MGGQRLRVGEADGPGVVFFVFGGLATLIWNSAASHLAGQEGSKLLGTWLPFGGAEVGAMG